MPLKHYERHHLRKELKDRFDLGELKGIAFDLGVDYRLFRHDAARKLAKALVEFCEARGYLGCLVHTVARRRVGIQPQDLLKGARGCRRWEKLQIIISGFHWGSLENLLEKLATATGVAPDDLTLVAAAWEKDVRLLVAARERTANKLTSTGIEEFDGDRYQLRSVQNFKALGSIYRRVWRYVAQERPPTIQTRELKPSIIWSDAYKIAGEDPNGRFGFPCRQLSVRYLGPVVLNGTDLTQLLEILMALGPIEITTDKKRNEISTKGNPSQIAQQILDESPLQHLCIHAPDRDLSLLLSPRQVEIRGLKEWKPAEEEYDVAQRLQGFLQRRQRRFPFLDRWVTTIMPGRERLHLRGEAEEDAGERRLGQTTTILLVIFALVAIFMVGFIAGMLFGP